MLIDATSMPMLMGVTVESRWRPLLSCGQRTASRAWWLIGRDVAGLPDHRTSLSSVCPIKSDSFIGLTTIAL